MKNKRDSGTALFLMEMIAVVCFFILCASICILVFVRANNLSRLARDTNQASLAAETVAEVWKAEDIKGLETRLGMKESETMGVVCWDSQWKLTDQAGEAKYEAQIAVSASGQIEEAQIKILRLEDSTELFVLTAKKTLHK